jgi:hypothetical protein
MAHGIPSMRMTHRIPFVRAYSDYAVGVYISDDPFSFAPTQGIRQPVVRAKDVTDVPAELVADPFMVGDNGTWYMFFEVMNAGRGKGEIGLATSSDGLRWAYQQIVLREPYHLAYPYVFRWNGDYYMVPETAEASCVRLYRADPFPTGWSLAANLLPGTYFDPSIFSYGDLLWMYAAGGRDDLLRLFYADDLTGPWTEHPQSPLIVGDPRRARPGGRVLVRQDALIRYAHDDHPYYGRQVRAFVVDQLSTTEYREHEAEQSPILTASGIGWNASGMHHIDANQIGEGRWIACVDGFRRRLSFGRKV